MGEPYALEAEESILGAMMSAPRAVVAALDVGLASHHFYRESHSDIFRAIVELDEVGAKPDVITTSQKLQEKGLLDKVGGIATLSTAVQMCPAVTNARHYAQIVVDSGTERALERAAHQLREIAHGEGTTPEKLAEAERVVAEVSVARGGDFSLMGESMAPAMLDIGEAVRTGKQRRGLSTGFIEFDRITHGLFPGQLILVAARPAMGKSLWVQNVAEYVAQKERHVCIFSLEMGSEEIGLRMASSISKVPHKKVATGDLNGDEWQKVQVAYQRIGELPIYTVDGTVNITELRARARRLQRLHGLDVLIVDYLQLMAGPGGGQKRSSENSRQVEVSDISRSLKLLALELKIPVVAVAQLNRSVEMRQNKRPMLSDLRDSGSLEQDADVVAFLYRDEYYDEDSTERGLCEVIIAKQRAGETGSFKLHAFLERCRFGNIARSSGQMTRPVDEQQETERAPRELTPEDIPF